MKRPDIWYRLERVEDYLLSSVREWNWKGVQGCGWTKDLRHAESDLDIFEKAAVRDKQSWHLRIVTRVGGRGARKTVVRTVHIKNGQRLEDAG